MAENATTLLRVLVTRRHWQVYDTFRHHYERTAEALAEREGDRRLRGLSVSKRQFERWYGGELKTRPYPDQCRVLEAMFGRPVDQLLGPAGDADVQDDTYAVPRELPHDPVPGTPDRVEPPSRSFAISGLALDPPLTFGGRALTDPTDSSTWGPGGRVERERQIAMAARRAFRFSASAESSSLGSETMAQLHDEVRRIALAYPRLALTTLLGDLVELQDTTFRILEHGHIRPSQAHELYVMAGMTSGMLAKASHDLGDPRSAMMQARTAYVCADNAEHTPLRAWIRGLQSLITYWAGQPQEAARYAALGSATGVGMRGTTAVWLACLEARAQAHLGDSASTRAAVIRADQAREAVREDDLDAYGGIMTFPAVRQLYYVAEAVVHLGDDRRNAEDQAASAVHAYRNAPPEDWAFGDEAGAHTNLSLARIADGELEGAAAAVRPVLDLPFGQRNFGIVSSARRVHLALSAPRFATVRLARDVREEIEDFTSVSTAAVLR